MKYINKSAEREVWDRMYQVLMSTREVKWCPTQKKKEEEIRSSNILIYIYIYRERERERERERDVPTSLLDRPSEAYCNRLTLTFYLGKSELADSSVCGAGCW
jgi:hypothetical protein